MNLFSASALFLRRRSVWEAADSGILLWRSSFIHFIPFFVLPVLIVACALRFLPGNPFFSYFILWWLKPLFDRMVLHVVSSRFFRAADKAPSLLKGLWGMRRGLLGDLLWRRFSPNRAAHMPIRVLERIDGNQYRVRKKNLAAGGINFCSLISFLGFSLEAFLLLTKMVFAIAAVQTFFPWAQDLIWNNMEAFEIFIFAAFCFNYILVGSLYVCMGFGLYINSRVEVEGWDLQLLFQKFAGRSQPGVPVLLLLCFFLALPQTAHGNTEPAQVPFDHVPFMGEGDIPSPGAGALEILENILASPDFGEYREGWGIRFREREQPERPQRDLSRLENWLERIRERSGYLLRGLVIIVMAAFVGAVLYWYWKNRWRFKGMSWNRDKGKHYITPLFSPESPESLFGRAEDFFRAGNLREAWAACLAGCIGACTRYRSLSFPADATEYGCLELVHRALPAESGGFAALVRSWILLAYGGRPPGEGAFEAALAYGRSLLEAPAPDSDRIPDSGRIGRRPDEA